MKHIIIVLLLFSIFTLLVILFAHELHIQQQEIQKQILEEKRIQENIIYDFFRVKNTTRFDCQTIRNATTYNDTHCRYISGYKNVTQYE